MSAKYELIEQYLHAFLKQEVTKTGLENVVIGLSGGIDSAVVAVLAQAVFGDKLLCIMLPSPYSSESSIKDAQILCEKFDISYRIVSIEPFVNAYLETTKDEESNSLDLGNYCARARMNLLYDISSKQRALVVGTSNKTELLLGYGTIYGDLCSALNPIGDLYKTQIFEFAKYLGVNDEIITKKPSADLWSNQSDEDDLGYTYEQIDTFLLEMIDHRQNMPYLLEHFDNEMVHSLKKRIFANQFKRKMPIIAKISNRSINHDFLYPRDIGL